MLAGGGRLVESLSLLRCGVPCIGGLGHTARHLLLGMLRPKNGGFNRLLCFPDGGVTHSVGFCGHRFGRPTRLLNRGIPRGRSLGDRMGHLGLELAYPSGPHLVSAERLLDGGIAQRRRLGDGAGHLGLDLAYPGRRRLVSSARPFHGGVARGHRLGDRVGHLGLDLADAGRRRLVHPNGFLDGGLARGIGLGAHARDLCFDIGGSRRGRLGCGLELQHAGIGGFGRSLEFAHMSTGRFRRTFELAHAGVGRFRRAFELAHTGAGGLGGGLELTHAGVGGFSRSFELLQPGVGRFGLGLELTHAYGGRLGRRLEFAGAGAGRLGGVPRLLHRAVARLARLGDHSRVLLAFPLELPSQLGERRCQPILGLFLRTSALGRQKTLVLRLRLLQFKREGVARRRLGSMPCLVEGRRQPILGLLLRAGELGCETLLLRLRLLQFDLEGVTCRRIGLAPRFGERGLVPGRGLVMLLVKVLMAPNVCLREHACHLACVVFGGLGLRACDLRLVRARSLGANPMELGLQAELDFRLNQRHLGRTNFGVELRPLALLSRDRHRPRGGFGGSAGSFGIGRGE